MALVTFLSWIHSLTYGQTDGWTLTDAHRWTDRWMGRLTDGREYGQTGGGQTNWHTDPNKYIPLDFLLTRFCYICPAEKV